MAGFLRRLDNSVAGASALIGAFACGASSEIPEIPAGVLIVDVRSPGEYQAGHFFTNVVTGGSLDAMMRLAPISSSPEQ